MSQLTSLRQSAWRTALHILIPDWKKLWQTFLVRTLLYIELQPPFCLTIVYNFGWLGLKLENLVAVATDGASNLCGKNNSLFTKLKEKNNRLVLLKCVCHSLNNSAQKACAQLPGSLGFLLRETRNWFSHSPLRIGMYETLYRNLNCGKKPPKLTQLPSTCWLAFSTAVKDNINQWSSLKEHFSTLSKDTDRSKNCYLTRMFATMYEDQNNYLYLQFLNSVLSDVTRVYHIFQSDKVDIVDAYNDLF